MKLKYRTTLTNLDPPNNWSKWSVVKRKDGTLVTSLYSEATSFEEDEIEFVKDEIRSYLSSDQKVQFRTFS